MARRTDNGLRSAISVIEKMLLTDPSPEVVVMRCLKQLMLLLNSEYGFSYHCMDSIKEGVIPWELIGCASSKGGLLKDVSSLSTSGHIPISIQAKLLSGRCLYGDDLTEAFPIAVPNEHPKIHNYFCLPLVDARRIYAVLFLCNLGEEASKEVESRLRPFIAAASCLLRAAEQRGGFQKSSESALATSEHPGLLSGVLDSMFNGALVVNDNDIVTLCNNAAASILSLPKTKIVGTPLSKFLPKGAPQIEGRLINDLLERSSEQVKRKTVWRGVPAIKGDGKKILVDLSAFEMDAGGTNFRGLIMDDISERIQSASDYHSTLQRFQVLTNLAPVAILQLNRDWECTYANDTWCEYCQMTPDEANGIGWLRGLYSNDASKVLNDLRYETSLDGKFKGEFRLQSPLGRCTWVKANACSLYSESGETTGLIITFNDITDHLDKEQKLRNIAEKDQLTGLVNRAFFNDRVELALKGIERFGSVALMFIDLDEFKHINDTLGHESGDELLQGVADRLRDTLRQVDTIARIGGDEFTVLLTNVQNVRSITAIADKLIEALNSPFILNDRPIYVTCSIGITVAENAGSSDTKLLLKQADVALYKAKEAGRNQYKFYTTALDRNADLHIHLRQSLKELGREDFKVVYQPQVNASTGKVIGLEALARWKHSDRDAVEPSIFIKMMEESGLINDFSIWLLDDVFSTMRNWLNTGVDLNGMTVSINLSAKQFRDKDLATYIHQRCRAHGLEPANIVLEVTETALVDDDRLASETLQKLKLMGFGIALDDFGTGYSSLLYLRNLPLDTVKIDRSFIKDVLHDESNAKIVSAILSLADSLNLSVVAEGVDNTDVKNWLIKNQCLVQQGFYFYKPMECREVDKLLMQGSSSKVVSIGSRVS